MTGRGQPGQGRGHELPRWLWLWMAPVPLIVIVTARLVAPELHAVWFNEKEGPIEWATVLVLLPAVAAGLVALRYRQHLPDPRLGRWLMLVTVGTFYFAGEEISWGQSLLHWETPEPFRNLNEQSETNLHNITSLLNEKPRLVLELFVVVGGLLVPWLSPERAETDWRYWFWPTRVVVPTAALTIGIYLPDHAEKYISDFSVSAVTGLRLSEPQEYYFAYFLLLYLCSLAVRLRARADGAPAATSDAS